MIELKDYFVYNVCKNIKMSDEQTEKIIILKDMANSIGNSLTYIYKVLGENKKNNYIYNKALNYIWQESFGKKLNIDKKNDVVYNFGVYFSLLKSFVDDLYICLAYTNDITVFRFDNCEMEIIKITEILKKEKSDQLEIMLHFDKRYYDSVQKILSYERTILAEKYAVDEIKNSVDKKFGERKIEIDKDFSNKKGELDNLFSEKIDRLMEKLESIENNASKAALVENFKGFIEHLKFKLIWAKITKVLSFIAIFISPSINLYLLQDDSFHVIFIRATVSLIVLLTFSVLFRVSLRKEDQLEQLLYKASNKTAIINYYEKNSSALNKENLKDVEKEFYNYLFKEIETREWNSPDIGQSIIDLIKAVKSS